MRFLLALILIMVLSAAAEYYLPWWTIGVAAFIVSLLAGLKPGRAFLSGFLGIGLLWLVVALVRGMANEHILAGRMAALFHLPGYGLFILVTVLIGALVGGFAALSGALLGRTQKS